MDIRTTALHPNTIFHIFNRGINGAQVFFEEKNYPYFLQQYGNYVHPFVETFSYCLLGNHFHLLIRVRSEEALDQVIKKNTDKPYYWHVSNAFSSWLQSYTRAMNKMYNRTGALFESPFKRLAVMEESYFSSLVAYIHQNPQKHGLVGDYRDYPYSSYHGHLAVAKTSKLNRKEVLDWFGGELSYVDFHTKQQKGLTSVHNENWTIE